MCRIFVLIALLGACNTAVPGNIHQDRTEPNPSRSAACPGGARSIWHVIRGQEVAATSSATREDPVPDDVTPAEMQGRLELFLQARFPKGFDKENIEELGKGAFSRVIRVHAADGSYSRVYVVPATLKLERTRREYESAQKLVEKLEHADETVRHHIYHINRAFVNDEHGPSGKYLPALEVEDCEGSVRSLFQKLYGPNGKFFDVSGAFKQMAQAVQVHHDHDIVHGDVKPDNFLVSKARLDRPTAVLMGDLGSARPEGEEAGSFTPGYFPLEAGVHSRGWQGALRKMTKDRDTYALMISQYETLVGTTIRGLDGKYWTGENLTVRPLVSAHTADPRVSKNLSMIAWTHFHTAKEAVDAVDVARSMEIRRQGARFLPDYYGPQILEKIPDGDAKKMIASAVELRDPVYADLADAKAFQATMKNLSILEQAERMKAYRGTRTGLSGIKLFAVGP